MNIGKRLITKLQDLCDAELDQLESANGCNNKHLRSRGFGSRLPGRREMQE